MKPKIRYLKTKTVKSTSFDATINVAYSIEDPDGKSFAVELVGNEKDHEFLEQVRTMMIGYGMVRVKLTVIP